MYIKAMNQFSKVFILSLIKFFSHQSSYTIDNITWYTQKHSHIYPNMLSNTFLSLVLAAGSLSAGVYGRTVPANLQAFYNQVKVYT